MIKKISTVGTNATVFPNLILGDNCFVGAGSVVRHNVKKNEIVVGNPGKFLKKVSYNSKKLKIAVRNLGII